MASHDTVTSSGAVRLADTAWHEGELAGLEAGRLEGRRNGRTAAFIEAAKLLEEELTLKRPDFHAVAEKLRECARW